MSSSEDELPFACEHNFRSFEINYLSTESDVLRKNCEFTEAKHCRTDLAHFRYIKILTWLRGLEE